MSQQQLPMPDPHMAQVWRIAAETARIDTAFTRREREERAAYYERMAQSFEQAVRLGGK